MASYKVYLALSTLVACHVANADDYEYERLKSLSQIKYRDITHPWDSHYDSFEAASSELLPHYYDPYESDEDHDGSSSEHLPISGVKKEPNEDKSFKKISSFYYPFANKDSLKHKELALNSKTAYCQEIKVKTIRPEGRSPKGITTCYRCKDPKTQSTFERCLYKSEPEESASTRMERFLHAPLKFRHRRSNSDIYDGPRNPYRFTDEYFTDASQDAPTPYEKKGEKCEKIVKDSMVCMLCKNSKTNGKYEQCSYVKQPREKAYAYSKSSSFGKPQEQKSETEAEEPEEGSYSESSGTRVSDRRGDDSPAEEEAHEYSYPSESRPKKTSPKQTSRTKEQDDEVEDSPTTDCKQVQRDSKTCTVCKDAKKGGTYEKCTYSYEPSQKLYKYSRSKSFGYPEKSSGSSDDSDKATGASHESRNSKHPRGSAREDAYFAPSAYSSGSDGAAEDESDSGDSSRGSPYYNSEYSNPKEAEEEHESYEDRATSPSEKSASEQHSENIDKDHCRKVEKDSMTCTICKDPKTGNDFEQCSYSYRPNDKLFSYSESSSFGNPRGSDGSEQQESEEEQPDGSEVVKGSYEPYTGPSYEASTKEETKSEDDKEKGPVDSEYLHTAKKKEEIEGFLQNFRKKDRSKCKKVMRDKMTCYQCLDEEGFQKEECVFVTGQEPDTKQSIAFHEVKEFQVDPASSLASSTKTRTANPPRPPLEPAMSASKNSYVKLEKPDNDYPDEASQTAEETKGAEPYDYTSETRSVYDKALGMTLPAYMFSTSEHEAAFDELVASSHRDER